MDDNVNNPLNTNSSLFSNKNIILIIFGLVFLFIAIFTLMKWTLVLSDNPYSSAYSEDLKKEIEEVIDQTNPQTQDILRKEIIKEVARQQLLYAEEFAYKLVPNAPTAVTLPPPGASDTEDAASYETFKVMAEGMTEDDVYFDNVYAIPYGDSFYGDFINTPSDYQFTIYQLHDELRQLVAHVNSQYQRPPLAQRISGVTQIGNIEEALFEKPETAAVYPNIRSAEAFLVAYILSELDPENENLYRQTAEAMAERGIAYGHYGRSDLEASRSLTSQYLSLFLQNNPEGLRSITSEEIIN